MGHFFVRYDPARGYVLTIELPAGGEVKEPRKWEASGPTVRDAFKRMADSFKTFGPDNPFFLLHSRTPGAPPCES